MTTIETYDRPAGVPRHVAESCIYLCWDDSEMQQHFRAIADGNISKVPAELRLSVASVTGDGGSVRYVGWAACSLWHFMWQVQTYVHEKYRGRSLATALCAALLLEHPERDCGVIATFHEQCYRIGRRLGWRDVRLYKRVSDGWINVGYRCGKCGADSAGLHAPAQEVCGVPLASGTEGAVA